MQKRPDIEVNLASEYFPQLERWVLLNQLDVVICPLRLLNGSKGDLAIEPLFEDDLVVVGRADHWLFDRDKITATNLEEATQIAAFAKHAREYVAKELPVRRKLGPGAE